MSKKVNVLNYIITMAITMGTLFWALMVCNEVYSGQMIDAFLRFLVGAIIAGFLNTTAHELGHFFAGKKNKFVFSSMVIWFFRWSRVKKKIKFDLVMLGEEAGYTEMIPTDSENVKKGLKNMTKGGIIASFILMIIGVPPIFMSFLPVWVYSIWVMFLPVGAYFFFGSALPQSSYGIMNDGGVLYDLKKDNDRSKVTVSLLKIQAELFSGKTPSEVDEKLYFDLPQLPEDDPTFAMLLDARYAYYLDKEDYANAKKTTDRLLSLEEYLPKSYNLIIKTNALYNACTFDFDEQKADDLTYELEKYLNNVNTAVNVRTKLAYLINVRQETQSAEVFFKKGYKEADRCQIKGLGEYERKLFDRLKLDLNKSE